MEPSFISDDSTKPLRLRAADPADLEIISACLQDAVTRQSDMSYRPREHRFAAVLNRFRWEREAANGQKDSQSDAQGVDTPGQHQRIRTGIHFNGCLGVRTKGLDGVAGDTVLSLLAIECEALNDGAAEVVLQFSGGAAIRLYLECIDCHLGDITEPWAARGRPDHPLDDSVPGT